MITFEIYSQCEMLPKDSTNNLSGKIAARVESVDMAKRGAPPAAAELSYGGIVCGY
jgi:hypothetical protein